MKKRGKEGTCPPDFGREHLPPLRVQEFPVVTANSIIGTARVYPGPAYRDILASQGNIYTEHLVTMTVSLTCTNSLQGYLFSGM